VATKLIVAVLAGAGVALPIAAYSSGSVAGAAARGQAAAAGSAAGRSTVAYGWGSFPKSPSTKCRPKHAPGKFCGDP
jgi:hypothetical protein